MISTIILDLDGPILDGRHRHYACYRAILTEHNFSPIEIDPYWDAKRARMDRVTLLRQSQAEDFAERFLAEWLDRIEQPAMLALDELQPGVLEILSEWKRLPLRIGIATMRNHRAQAIDQLCRLGVGSLVDEVLVSGSQDGFGGKVKRVGEWLGDDRLSQSLWVGDTEVDIFAARALQIPICAVTCGLRTAELLAAEEPDYLLSDLREVRQLVGQLQGSSL